MLNLRNFINRGMAKAASLRVYDHRKLFMWHEINHLKRFVDEFEVDCIFDIGANRGQYASMLRKQVGFKGAIISFEPIDHAANHIETIRQNDPDWSVEQIAVSNANGQKEFSIMAHEQFSSFSAPHKNQPNSTKTANKTVKKISVTTETLESAYLRHKKKLKFQRPFLKMDTQGHDATVVRSGASIIHEFVGLQSELSIAPLYETSMSFADAIALYEELGFTLSAFTPNNAGHFPQLLETDCIMVNKTLLTSEL